MFILVKSRPGPKLGHVRSGQKLVHKVKPYKTHVNSLEDTVLIQSS